MNNYQTNGVNANFLHTDFSDMETNLNKINSEYLQKERISNILLNVGIVPNVRGYGYLKCAVELAVKDNSVLNNITKRLYPQIAKEYDTTASRVERGIRHAIEIGTNSGKMENLNILFGVQLYCRDERPTNGEFIALIADKIIIEYLQK